MKKTIFILLSFLLLVSCNGYEHETIPTVQVDFSIYPNDVTYYSLNHYGGHMYFTGGVRGIIIYRLDQYTFMAYDRACPYDWEDDDSWIWVEESGLTLIDSCCGSRFNVLDGSVVNGPAIYSLKHYSTTFDGVKLRVYN